MDFMLLRRRLNLIERENGGKKKHVLLRIGPERRVYLRLRVSIGPNVDEHMSESNYKRTRSCKSA